jgi:hypothetical protein
MLYLVSVIVKKFWSVIRIFCINDISEQLKYVILNLILNVLIFARCISGVEKLQNTLHITDTTRAIQVVLIKW